MANTDQRARTPESIVQAYLGTKDIIFREYWLRLLANAAVAWIVALIVDWRMAVAWWSAMTAFLSLEATVYKRFFAAARDRVPARIAWTLAGVSFFTSVTHTLPVWALVGEGSAASYFAATAFMAGSIIHLTVTNANTRLIYASAVAPMFTSFAMIGVYVSVASASFIPMLTALIFIAAMFTAYTARARIIDRLNDSMAEAEAGRAAAAKASAAKSDFLAKMSHELRTPLNGILGMAQTLRSDVASEDARARVETIIDSGDALLAMLNEILDHARIEAGRVALDPEDHDLGEILKRATDLFRPAAAEKGVALTLDVSGLATPRLMLDGIRVRQCVVNLVSNALKFTSAGAVLVKAAASDRGDGAAQVTISVSDTGPGLTDEQQARIFNAFEQGDNSITRRFGGAGLGLAITRAIVDAMGGAIAVESRPGAGATFTFSFSAPLASRTPALSAFEEAAAALQDAAPAIAAAGADFASPHHGPVRVLVVEDNDVNRRVAVALLKPLQVEVIEAANGREALDRLAQEPVDFVLMDLHMPVMDGIAATRAIRQSGADWSGAPVVMLTAAVSDRDEAEARAAGVDDFLAKPVKGADLEAAIARFAGRGPARAQTFESVDVRTALAR